MSTVITRFTPFRDARRLQGELDRLFGAAAAWDGSTRGTWTPPVDIHEDAEGITLTADLPGFAPGDIDLRVENNTLTLKGERALEKKEGAQHRRVERQHGTFLRSFTLPENVDAERIKADSKHGVLTVFLPRREESKPRQIQVKVEA